MQEQVASLIHVPNTWYTEAAGPTPGRRLRRCGPISPEQCFFCNSGTEANEAAIKPGSGLNSAPGRYKIISMLNSFHGRTMGAAQPQPGQPKYHAGVEPAAYPGFKYAPVRQLRRGHRSGRRRDVRCILVEDRSRARAASTCRRRVTSPDCAICAINGSCS